MKASDLMQALADAGAPMEAILIAVRALEEGQEQIEQRRAADRERKRRQRARACDADGTVTGPSRDEDGTVTGAPALSLPPNEINSNPPTHTHPEGVNAPARKGDPWPKPDWADAQHWADLKANRKAKRLPNTPTAYAKFLRDIDAMTDPEWPPGRLLEAIVARGWAAAYDPREHRRNEQQSPRNDDIQNPYARVAARREAERLAALG